MSAVENPQIHAFSNDRTHSADDLNAMGIAVMDLVAEVNALRAEIEDLKVSKANARKTA
jgi:hypothetical protein